MRVVLVDDYNDVIIKGMYDSAPSVLVSKIELYNEIKKSLLPPQEVKVKRTETETRDLKKAKLAYKRSLSNSKKREELATYILNSIKGNLPNWGNFAILYNK